MKRLILLLLVMTALVQAEDIYLIVRADDIGSSHAANLACIESYTDGIARSVEVMVPCAWFMEAAEMLQKHPEYDVGVHLTLTSEWSNIKWGPLTCAPSLVDSNGYFFPKQKNWEDPEATDAFWNANPDMQDVEQELRAQIEMALKHIPQVSHLSSHMGVGGVDPKMSELVNRLAKEYGLDIDLGELGVDRARWGASGKDYFETRERKLVEMLENLQPGAYLLVEHPGLNTPEMKGHGHSGYEHVATHRDGVTRSFTSDRVKEVIKKRDIKLISYKDAQELFGSEN